jgi:hypothetical protein
MKMLTTVVCALVLSSAAMASQSVFVQVDSGMRGGITERSLSALTAKLEAACEATRVERSASSVEVDVTSIEVGILAQPKATAICKLK